MATIKPTEKSILRRRNRISELKDKRTRFVVMEQGKGSPFWGALKPMLEEHIKSYTDTIEKILRGDELGDMNKLFSDQCRAFGGKHQAQAIIDAVDHNEELLGIIDNEIKRLEVEIEAALDSGALEPQRGGV